MQETGRKRDRVKKGRRRRSEEKRRKGRRKGRREGREREGEEAEIRRVRYRLPSVVAVFYVILSHSELMFYWSYIPQ